MRVRKRESEGRLSKRKEEVNEAKGKKIADLEKVRKVGEKKDFLRKNLFQTNPSLFCFSKFFLGKYN